MPDIELRFNLDMLVISAPIDAALEGQGFDPARDLPYLNLMEPDSLVDALRMEKAAGAYVFKGAFKGVYPMDADGNLTAVRTSYETQEQTAAREAAMRELLDSMSKG